jgi:hypothetical protein
MPLIDSRELAKRFRVPESWIRDRTRARTSDQIPRVRPGGTCNPETQRVVWNMLLKPPWGMSPYSIPHTGFLYPAGERSASFLHGAEASSRVTP